jgi:iron complex outermembrane receptor protein
MQQIYHKTISHATLLHHKRIFVNTSQKLVYSHLIEYFMRFFLFICFFHVATLLAGQSAIAGWVVDEDQEPLPGATIILLPDSLICIAGLEGNFYFGDLPPGSYQLQVSYIGFTSRRVNLEHGDRSPTEVTITLQVNPSLLETIVVTDEHAKQEATLATEHVSGAVLEKHQQGTFAKTLERLPGISSINVGVGIGKPVIRGLSANRIIVNHQGIKQESQQWGSDHGLEIDQYEVEQVEVIKGPASLQYGSDGLGGVINIQPAKIPVRNTFRGSLQGIYKGNNEHWGGSAFFTTNINDVFLSARYSRQAFGDYRVPATNFTYNGFTLPIFDNRLKNTAGKEQNIHLSTGLFKTNSITRINYSHYRLEAGLFSGAVGIPRSYGLEPDGNLRDIDVPGQLVDHYKWSVNQTFIFGKDHLNFNLGWQRNFRREFSFPEFHSIPSSLIDPNNTLALSLFLETLSANAHYEHHTANDWKTTIGMSIQRQENTRGGFEFLLPDFSTFRSGIYTIAEKEWRPGWTVNGGLRLDYGHNQSTQDQQFVWNSNEIITDTLLAPATDDPFFNWSASLGSNWNLGDGRWNLKANFGKSFRVPYPSETVSNGIHHGTFRHEQGDPDLDSEHGYQLDLGLNWRLPNWKGTLATYFNYFQNYIYLGPTFPAQFSPLPEAGQLFRYRQDDAIYTGFELGHEWDIWRGIYFHQVADFVQSYNLNTRLALPFTPQPRVRTEFGYSRQGEGLLAEMEASLTYEYVMAAEGTWAG